MKKILLILGIIMTMTNASAQLDHPLVIKTEKIFNELNASTMHLLKEYYAEEVNFHDPLTTISGLEPLTKYYENLYQNVKSIRFDFAEAIVNQNNIMVTWTMVYQVDALNSGKEISVIGNSHIKFNDQGLVIYHRDYFDVAQMVYDHIPVVGWAIQKIKNRLKNH
jgi:hypothetical protein